MKIFKNTLKIVFTMIISMIIGNSAVSQSIYVPAGSPQIGTSLNNSVGIGTTNTPYQYARLDLGTKQLSSGGFYGLFSNLNVASGNLTCDVFSCNSTASIWSGKQEAVGVKGRVTNITDIQSSMTYSRAIGGDFLIELEAGANIASNPIMPTILAGTRSKLTGAFTGSVPSGTILAAIYGQDELKTTESYAGYFDGNTFVQGNHEVYNGDIVLGSIYKKFLFHTRTFDPNSNGLYFVPQNNGAWDFSKQMVLRDDGNVEMNGNLKVSGTVYAKEIIVQLPPFPDYVFSKDYSLMSLNELDSYIKDNSHLPNIPSAVEISENGIGVGELQNLQMEKIEELTLYLIEINKRLNDIEKENKSLKKQLESQKNQAGSNNSK